MDSVAYVEFLPFPYCTRGDFVERTTGWPTAPVSRLRTLASVSLLRTTYVGRTTCNYLWLVATSS